jgi:CheY-like chemotaxis protein
LESQPGHGAKFTVTLPAADTLAEADPRRPPPVGGRAGVLIVEDDEATARLFAAYLEREGYHVTVVGSGEEALAAAQAGSFEVVLLDVRLPGMDGWEVLRRLKADRRLRDTPVLIMSVVDEQPVGLALGAADYFVKPVDRQALLSWLARSGLIPSLSERTVTVLAVDDDPRSLGLIEMSLSPLGITVLTAGDGTAGLRLAQEVPVDLIICDLLMPGLDGYDLIAALQADPRTRDIPVVVLTAQDLTADEKARLTGKASAIVAKMPEAARPDQMIATISRITGSTATTATAPAATAPAA